MASNHDALIVAKARKRPRSRGSTASIRSATTQPTLDQTYSETPELYQGQWISHEHSRQREIAPAPPQMTAEDLLLASQLQASREYSMDASTNQVMHDSSFHHHAPHMGRHSMSADSFAANASYVDESQMMDRSGMEEGDSFSGLLPNVKPGSRSSANNETEMRQLFSSNRHRSLQDVAEELHGNERGPNSERTRQVFAMLWINSVCAKGKGSVPRGRVYANYASRCATERITVLNPASFGKLVRVLFPGLKTRRLGVRGESKYHYVSFTLMEDQIEARESPIQAHVPLPEHISFSNSFNSLPTIATSLQHEPAPFEAHNDGTNISGEVNRSHEFSHNFYNQPMITTVEQLQASSMKTAHSLYLAPEIEVFPQNDALVLPPIKPYLPAGTDPDAAKSLAALYRSHCTSLVECIRYCKEKTFFHLFTSFQGTLTTPVQKLFGKAAVAPWIETCDFVLYQRMMTIVSALILQVVPKPVLDTLRSISEKLVAHIRESFRGLPQHVVRAKEAPAAIFSALLDRALRVNLTAHAAANMLSNPANRDLMYLEWMSTINLRKLAECVPAPGMDDVVTLLLNEMRDLLNPVSIPWAVECLTIQGEMAMRTGRHNKIQTNGDSSASNVLDRWVSFLRSLPSHFPYASHTDIVWTVERLGTAVMRDLTIAQCKSFGSWWVTKCWVDEMIQFLAEQGGFMKQTSARTVFDSSRAHAGSLQVITHDSRYRSGSDDFHMLHMSQSQPDRASFVPAPSARDQQPHPDDSGIGIRTPDEDLPIDKFGLTPTNSRDIFVGTELQDQMENI